MRKMVKTTLLVAICSLALVVKGLVIIDDVANQNSKTARPVSTRQPLEQIFKIPTVDEKEVTEPSEVAFMTIYQEDETLPKGSTKVVVEGRNGVKNVTYRVVYVDGIVKNKEKLSEEVIVQPVNKIIANGTYVAPSPETSPQSIHAQQTDNCENGTYINSAGNAVCRPSSRNTGGATARCRDGSYSYSQSRRGTCSRHGGVSAWL